MIFNSENERPLLKEEMYAKWIHILYGKNFNTWGLFYFLSKRLNEKILELNAKKKKAKWTGRFHSLKHPKFKK